MMPLTWSVILVISFIDVWGAGLNVYLTELIISATVDFAAVVSTVPRKWELSNGDNFHFIAMLLS